MTPTDFRTLARSVTAQRSVLSLHPAKLVRWHQALFDLPEPLFLQLGCGALFDQLQSAVAAISKMSAVLGPDLKFTYSELAARQVGSWSFLVRRPDGETSSFLARWDSRSSSWSLLAVDDPRARVVSGLRDAVALAGKWAIELDERARQDARDLEELEQKARDAAELHETPDEREEAPSVEPS